MGHIIFVIVGARSLTLSRNLSVAAEDVATWDKFPVGSYGKLVYDQAHKSYGAHCDCITHTKPCRANRVLSKLPIGYLVAWLIAGHEDKYKTNFDHQMLKTSIDLGEPLNLEHRERARKWFATLPGAAAVLAKESEFRKIGDPDEPILR
jgi:hypothetical protein